MTEKNIAAAVIEVGEMTDAELNRFVDFIRDEMKDRARRRNREARATIKVGDKVKLSGSYKPQYLTGMTGVVTEFKSTRVVVKLDAGPVGKFRSGNVVTNPSGLEVLS